VQNVAILTGGPGLSIRARSVDGNFVLSVVQKGKSAPVLGVMDFWHNPIKSGRAQNSST
jgi:hypothetical protein